MTPAIDEKVLLGILLRCRELVSQSEDSDWSCMNVPDILAMMNLSISNLESSLPADINQLRFLFVVTGPLQETSMSNGWSDEFLKLAARFDHAIGIA